MRIKELANTVIASFVSLAIVVGDMGFLFASARLVAFARGPYNAVATVMAAVAMVEARDAYAQTPEELGSTSGAVDPDDPEAMQRGRSAAAAAMRDIQRPGMDGFTLRIQKPDGTYWEQNMGERADGTTYTEADLATMRQGYGDPLTSESQAQAFESEESQFMLGTFKNHGHTGVHSEPGIVGTEDALRQMEASNSWQNLYGDCGTVQRGNQDAAVIPEGERQTCYRVEAPSTENCEIESHPRLRPKDNIPTAVTVVSAAAIGGSNFALPIVSALERAPNTSVAAYVFNGEGTSLPITTIPNDGSSTYATMKGWGESVRDPNVTARFNTAVQGSPRDQAAVLDFLAHQLANRTEPRKIMLVLTASNVDASWGHACVYTAAGTYEAGTGRAICRTIEVQDNYRGSIIWAGIGPGANSTYQSRWDYFAGGQWSNASESNSNAYLMLLETMDAFDIDHVYYPERCIRTAEMIQSGVYDGTLQCTSPAGVLNTGAGQYMDGCNIIDGVFVCNDQHSPATSMQEPPITQATDGTSIGKACGKVQAQITSFCWTGVDGVHYCEYGSGGSTAPLCDNLPAGCGRMKSTCVESTRDDEGHCHVYFEEYACGRNTNEAVSTTGGGCGEPIPCMDGECMDDPPEQNENWVQTFTMLQAVEWAGKDAANCNPETGDCPLFPGEQMYCRQRKSYIDVPCCDDAPHVGLTEYMTAMKIIYKGMQASGSVDWLAAQFTGSGWWQSLSSGTANVWSTVSKPFVTAYESLAESSAGWLAESGTETAAETLTASTIQQQLMDQAYRFLNTINPDLANFFFQPAVDAAGQATGSYVLSAAMQQVMAFISFVMWVYMIYQLAQIAFTIFADCGENDGIQGMFNVKREQLKLCHVMPRCDKPGSFGITKSKTLYGCCFSSPLSRILQEQIRPQIGLSWGSNCNPNCSSITLADLQRIDWSLVDLSEWTEILFASGILPDGEAAEAAKTNETTATSNRDDPSTYDTPDANTRRDNRTQYVETFGEEPSGGGP